MDRTVALVLTLLVGLLIAAQPPANGQLAGHVGDLGAAFTSLLISAAIVGVLLVVAGEPGRLTGGLGEIRPEHLIGAAAGAAVVLVSLIAVRSLGAGGVTAALVATQLIGSMILDRMGAFDLDGNPITAQRLAGAVLLLGGTALVTTS